ncbi:MAG: hypothetical protein BAJALOKI2v1_1030008 [Promethearchaeota archaeon]|nr:MAG: hypothetical protein BAJALOKI2v1_1030008 [Candidatus Lokiarchaeota archaeon]
MIFIISKNFNHKTRDNLPLAIENEKNMKKELNKRLYYIDFFVFCAFFGAC